MRRQIILVVLATFGAIAHAASGTYTPQGNVATVEGVDSENRGYRDDVWQLIHDSYSNNEAVKVGAVAVAKSYQSSITPSVLAQADTSEDVRQDAQVGGCAVYHAGLEGGRDVLDATKAIYARTFNTDARLAARQVYVKAAKNVGVMGVDTEKCATTLGLN